MTQEEIKKLSQFQMDAATRRLPKLFGPTGNKLAKCENKCGADINIDTFSIFMFPETEKFKILFVCRHCAQQLANIHDYTNKN